MVLLDMDNKRNVHLNRKEALHHFYHDDYNDTAKAAGYKFAKTKEEEPVIPSPDIFAFEEPANTSSSSRSFHSNSTSTTAFRLPSISECATHLELIQVFYVLRQHVLRSPEIDASMGIVPVRETKTGRNGDTKTFKDAGLWERRQVKWPKFVEFAVVRFLEWRKTLATQNRHSKFYLPPLDVLMVWHSFLLNPRLLQEHCRGEPLYRTRMPWQKIHESIDNGKWNFRHNPDAARSFEAATGLDADLFEQLSRWAAASGSDSPPDSDSGDRIAASTGEDGDGHHDAVEPGPSEPKFQSVNPKLTAFKLRPSPDDEEDDVDGAHAPDSSSPAPISSPVVDLSLNRKGLTQAQIYAVLFHTARTMTSVTDTATQYGSLASPSVSHQVSATTIHPDPEKGKEPENLATLLFSAVQRQTSFIDKMNTHLWIRSPSVEGTLGRAITRYEKFLTLLKFHGGVNRPIVPTLDIDLVWHTHQCSSGLGYVRDMKNRVGRFINHDDSIPREGPSGLDDGFKRTRSLWRMRFGEEYKGCRCWDCEGLLDELELEAENSRVGVSAGAGDGGVGEEGLADVNMDAMAKKVHDRVMYYRFVEFSRRKKKPLPLLVPPPSE